MLGAAAWIISDGLYLLVDASLCGGPVAAFALMCQRAVVVSILVGSAVVIWMNSGLFPV